MTKKKDTGKCIIIAGGTGSGKTTIVKQLLAAHKGNKLIYDVNNEYGQEFIAMDEFFKKALRAENSIIVFEEATIFFSTSGGQIEMRELLVRKRHSNNLFIFNFHSLSQIPLYILMFCDKLIMKKTNDQLQQVERKFKNNMKIYEAYSDVYNSPDRYVTKVIKLQ